MLNLFEKIKRFIKESKWGTIPIYVLYVRTGRLIKKTKSTSAFIVRLIRLLFNKNNDELCFVTFDVVTGNYKVLTYFSTEHSLGLFYEVLKSMSEQLLKNLTKLENPEHNNVTENIILTNKDGNC